MLFALYPRVQGFTLFTILFGQGQLFMNDPLIGYRFGNRYKRGLKFISFKRPIYIVPHLIYSLLKGTT